MNPFSMHSRKVLAAVCGCGLAAGLLAFRAQADPWNKMTTLTVNQTIQVEDRVLDPGTYVFKLAQSDSNRHVVQIFNSDQSRIIDTVLAIPNYRLQPTGKSQFMFWETPPGSAPALRAWFYPGDNFGQEFTYPKHITMLQAAATITQTAQAAPPPPPPAAAPAPEPEQPQAERQAPPAQEQPQEQPQQMAQATPPPPPARPEPTPEPSQLPHTASPFSAIGLGGMLSVALYGLIRLKRLA